MTYFQPYFPGQDLLDMIWLADYDQHWAMQLVLAITIATVQRTYSRQEVMYTLLHVGKPTSFVTFYNNI